jgi:steroid 5-alpha reductase family enzyme
MPLLTTLAINAAVSAVAFLALWAVSLRTKDVSFIDAWWGPSMALLAWSTLLQGPHTPHGLLLTGLCTLWAARLGLYLLWRWRKHGADRRYVAIFAHYEKTKRWNFATTSLIIVFGLQAVLSYFVALPVQLGQGPGVLGGLAFAGAALTIVGILFETVGDAQLTAFKANPDNAGKVMDKGLWRYTRHPNYFGDACVWWGLYLIAAETGLGAWALPGPVLMTFLLTKWSGVPTTEGKMRKSKPGYEEYVARTSGFVPWFPRNNPLPEGEGGARR